MAGQKQIPDASSYDVVIIGGAIMGASTAWFLSDNKDFDGRVLVIERDMTYQHCSTSHTNSCMRQQFSTELNVRISQFAADFVKNLRSYMGGDDRVPELSIRSFGYMYLADIDAFAGSLRAAQAVQRAAGAATELLTPDDIHAAYPFYNLDGIVLGSINRVDEGYWDGAAVNDWWRRQSRERGVEWIENEVVAINRSPQGTRVESVTLGSGEVIACGAVVNCAGPRAALVANMVGVEVPIEPRKRFSWVFKADKTLECEMPLTIDPSGVHVREYGKGAYLCGGHTDADPAVEHGDHTMDFSLWESHIWPALAARIPQFEAIKVQSEWAGHYAMNTFDQNAIMGPPEGLGNFIFLNGFSGHGLQQSPAMGRGTAEWLTYGEYRALDMTPFGYTRIPGNRPIIEKAII